MNGKMMVTGLAGVALLLSSCMQPAARSAAIPLEAYLAPDNVHWFYSAPNGAVQALDQSTDPSSLGSVVSASNAFGPFEINMSNGEVGPRDGHPLSMGGKSYAYGLGMHADAELVYATSNTSGLTCHFTADVGIDDEVNDHGSVNVQILANGVKLYDSGVLQGADPAAKSVDITFTSPQRLTIRASAVGDNNFYDHVDIASPKVTCAPA